jgi:ABC-type polar amino acid transport system ATPase subunit
LTNRAQEIPSSRGRAPATEAMIEIEDLHKSYGAVKAIRGVSLNVAPGSVYFVIGPSGCGKSTLLRCINLLEEPTSGSLRVGSEKFRFGAGHKRPSGRMLVRHRVHIGMVFQTWNLFPHKTAMQNVMEGPLIVKGMRRKEVRPLALELLDKVGLADKADVYPSQLSGGQAQRVAIARALAMSPRVMLFDEVTSALDPELVGEVLSVMRQLVDEGTTMVVVTHEMAFALEVADQVCFMDEGQIVEQGSADEVLRTPQHPRTQVFLSRFHGTGQGPAR